MKNELKLIIIAKRFDEDSSGVQKRLTGKANLTCLLLIYHALDEMKELVSEKIDEINKVAQIETDD